MPKRIVSIGEPMIELAPSVGTDAYQLAFAGDTLNTAWYLKQLSPQTDVDYVTRVGTDDMSERLVDFVQSAGVGVSHISRCDTRTAGLYMISLKDGERSFAYWRGQSAARELAADAAALTHACKGADIVYFSGITLAILEGEGRENLYAALRAARDGGALVAFDPNLRPRLWPNNTTMCDTIMEAAAACDIALPSHDDEATFFGDADPQATLNRYANAGASTVVVKNGDGPVLFRHNNTAHTYTPAPVTDIVDTTAAGDSFNAGVLADFDPAKPLAPLIEQASGLAAKVIRSRGALVAL